MLRVARKPFEFFLTKLVRTIRDVGVWCLFTLDCMQWTFRPPFRGQQLIKHMEFIGVKSMGIIMLTGFFSGAVFALQSGKVFMLFNMEVMVGATVAMSLTRELAPVFSALMVVARACSSMAAELGSMKVTEQIDAMQTMAVEPMQYLVMPRVWAATFMLPLLTMLFNFMGMLGAYVVGIYLLQIHEGPFMDRVYYYVDTEDIWGGVVKAAVFGFAISLISCSQGFWCKGGASGVGRATTRAVVLSAVTILVLDYFLTTWILEYF